jgi:hypothetical protein
MIKMGLLIIVCSLLFFSVGFPSEPTDNVNTNVIINKSTTIQSTLVSEIITLKTNGVSDDVILEYIKHQNKENNIREIDIESYEFFYTHYLYPRALKYQEFIRNRKSNRIPVKRFTITTTTTTTDTN